MASPIGAVAQCYLDPSSEMRFYSTSLLPRSPTPRRSGGTRDRSGCRRPELADTQGVGIFARVNMEFAGLAKVRDEGSRENGRRL